MDPSAAIQRTITETINAQYIGSMIPLFFFGILSNQVYMYFQAFPNDKPGVKVLVLTVYAIVSTQAALFIHDGFEIFGPGFGNVENAFKVRSTWLSGLICDGIVACFVQVFYAWRISIISGKKFPFILIVMISLASFIPSFVAGVRLVLHHNIEGYTGSRAITIVWLGSAVACDILIAGFMIFYLKRSCPVGSQFKSTVSKVDNIIGLTIQSGTLTAGFAIGALSILTIPRLSLYSATVLSSLSGVYSTTFMSLLTSRIKFSGNTRSGTSHESGESCETTTSANQVYGGKEDTASGMKFASHSPVLVNVIRSQSSADTMI